MARLRPIDWPRGVLVDWLRGVLVDWLRGMHWPRGVLVDWPRSVRGARGFSVMAVFFFKVSAKSSSSARSTITAGSPFGMAGQQVLQLTQLVMSLLVEGNLELVAARR